jgi:hypothetical protein
MSEAIDPTRCPLCGQPNRCAMEIERETGTAPGACWCAQVEFASELLARVPVAVRGRACICAACAAAELHRDAAQRPR